MSAAVSLPTGLQIVRGMAVDMQTIKKLSPWIFVLGEADGSVFRIRQLEAVHPDFCATSALDLQQWREYECGLTAHLIHCPVTEADGPGMEW